MGRLRFHLLLCTADDLRNLLGNGRLPGTVIPQGKLLEHITRVVRRGIHSRHAGILLGAELYTIALVVVAGISIAMLALAFFRLRTPNTFLLVTHYDAEVEPEVMDFIRRIKVQRLRSKTVTPGGVELTVEVQLRERFDIVNKLMDTEGVHNATLIACQSEAGN